MRSRILALAMGPLCCMMFASVASAARVLRVGSKNGIRGQFKGIQAAVDAAKPGDWILIGPGDYHEASTRMPSGAHGDDRAGAGILIQKRGLWLRGMDRNRVWIDGTKPGSPRCSTSDARQDFGPKDPSGQPGGRNGILIYKARGVKVENLSVCNFVTGSRGGGDQIWWDGGASTGTQSNLGSWGGSYLTATSSYYKDDNSPSAGYGIYSSNTKGPGRGVFANDYASNMNDSAYYVGACPDCNVTLDHVHGENAPQGYSGTNAGGHVVIQNSEFSNNETGFATGDLNNDDAPSPQDGTCPGNAVNPNTPPNIQRTHVCWVFKNNYIHDNNNPNVPSKGVAGAAPVGTGVTIYGGRHDVFTGNRFVNNGAWGIVFVPFPDNSQPPPIAHCQGGTDLSTPGSPFCYFDDWGSEFANNSFTHNGYFGNPSNGDIAEISQSPPINYNPDSNCFHDNVDTRGPVTSDPANIDSRNQCGKTYSPAFDSTFFAQVSCDSGLLASCPSNGSAKYPKKTGVQLRLPAAQRSMSNPCRGVPADPWCSGQVTRVGACLRGGHPFRVRALLAPREKLVRFSARFGRHRFSTRRRVLKVKLGRRHGHLRVKFTERIKVGRKREHFTFTRIYRLCGR
jgi:Periplasmic copper-binding protein (NosD)